MHPLGRAGAYDAFVNVVTKDTEAQQAAIARARTVLEADARVRAAWLQGSFARGDADAWSDIDCYAAVANEAFEEFVNEQRDVLEHIAPIVGELRVPLGATRLIAATLDTPEGLVRFDFFAEPVSQAGSPRQMAPLILFDRDGLATRFAIQPLATPEALRRRVETMVSGYFFGAMWPVRLAGRETPGTMLLNALSVVYGFIVPAILVCTRPEEAFRELLHVEHWLAREDRERVDALVAELHRAFAGVGEHEMDGAALAAAHARLVGTCLLELRRACDATGVEWPARSEAAYRAWYRRELGVELEP